MNDKIKRLSKEICQNGELQDYSIVIEFLIEYIYSKGCRISCNYQTEGSSIEHSMQGEYLTHIRIGMKNRSDKPLTIIWDILHEFGHHLSGKPNATGEKIIREIEAWDIAYKELFNFPVFAEFVKNFQSYKETCLLTYMKNESNLKTSK